MALAAAKRFESVARRALERRGRFVAVLAGGSTPLGLYARLASTPFRERVAWSGTVLAFGDERCVPPGHERSNFRMARESLIDPLGLEASRVLRVEGERGAEDAAARYERRLAALYPGEGAPRFDLLLLGMGSDGHTASLFPATAALDERHRWVVANDVPGQPERRVTLTYPALNGARHVLLLITGESKAPVVAEAFGGRDHAGRYPVERVAPGDGTLEVLLDEAAASRT